MAQWTFPLPGIMRSGKKLPGRIWSPVSDPITSGGGAFVTVQTNRQGVWIACPNSSTADSIVSYDDGLTWSIMSSLPKNSWLQIEYGNGIWMVMAASNPVGSTTRFWRSFDDGLTWSPVPAPPANTAWGGVAYLGGSEWVITTTGAIQTRSMDNGDTWVNATVASNGAGFGKLRKIGGSVYSCGNSGTNRLRRSDDGCRSWVDIQVGSGTFVDIDGNDDTLILVQTGTSPKLRRSDNGGASWSNPTLPTIGLLQGVRWTGAVWAVISNGIITSEDDGVSWDNTVTGTGISLFSIESSGDTVMAMRAVSTGTPDNYRSAA